MTASWRMDWKTSFPSAAAVRYMRDFVIPDLEGIAAERDKSEFRHKGERWRDHHDFDGVPAEVLDETAAVLNGAVGSADLDHWKGVAHALERVKWLW